MDYKGYSNNLKYLFYMKMVFLIFPRYWATDIPLKYDDIHKTDHQRTSMAMDTSL